MIDKNSLGLELSLAAIYNEHWPPLKLSLDNIIHTTEGTRRVEMAKKVHLENSFLFVCSILSLFYPTIPITL